MIILVRFNCLLLYCRTYHDNRLSSSVEFYRTTIIGKIQYRQFCSQRSIIVREEVVDARLRFFICFWDGSSRSSSEICDYISINDKVRHLRFYLKKNYVLIVWQFKDGQIVQFGKITQRSKFTIIHSEIFNKWVLLQ